LPISVEPIFAALGFGLAVGLAGWGVGAPVAVALAGAVGLALAGAVGLALVGSAGAGVGLPGVAVGAAGPGPQAVSRLSPTSPTAPSAVIRKSFRRDTPRCPAIYGTSSRLQWSPETCDCLPPDDAN